MKDERGVSKRRISAFDVVRSALVSAKVRVWRLHGSKGDLLLFIALARCSDCGVAYKSSSSLLLLLLLFYTLTLRVTLSKPSPTLTMCGLSLLLRLDI